MEGVGGVHHLEVLEALGVEEVQVHDLPVEVVEEALQEVDVGQQKEEAVEELGQHALGAAEEEGLLAMEVVVEGFHALAVVEEMEHHLDEVVEVVVLEHHSRVAVEEEEHDLRGMEVVEAVVVCHVKGGEGEGEAEAVVVCHVKEGEGEGEVEVEDLLKI